MSKYIAVVFCTLVSLLCTRTVWSQQSFAPPATAPSFRAVEATMPLILDGKPLEEDWAKAEAVLVAGVWNILCSVSVKVNNNDCVDA